MYSVYMHKGAWVKGDTRELKYSLCSTCEVYEYLPRRDAFCKYTQGYFHWLAVTLMLNKHEIIQCLGLI